MKTEEKLNMTMLCDFYELTMGNGYFQTGFKDRITYFDVYFRSVPDGGGFAIAAGLEQLIEYIEDLHFDEQDIAYLRGKGIFCEEFLEYLRTFRFTGDIYAVPEGTPVFPKEPMVIVRAPAIEAQLVETFALLTVNHQSLIATKANRIARAAKGRGVMEFGSRRAQGTAAAIVGARAAYIGGCIGTACTITDELYGVPALGTMAHAWVQMFDTEYDAFKTYCELYPGNAIMLVDTYDTLHSGIPNAIRAFDEVLRPKGITKCGIRLEGEGVWGLTAAFLNMWSFLGGELHEERDYYRPHTSPASDGFCQPFLDGPQNNPDNPAEDTFLQLIGSARRFLYITTPYFIPDENIMRALCIAGDGGVDVRLMLPGTPDHWYADAVADSYIGELLEHHVKVYRYTPGFLHAKSIMVDREAAFVGSVNFDYRSFELHYECGVMLYGASAIESLLEDMDGILDKSHAVTPEEWAHRGLLRRMFEPILRIFSIWM